MFQRMLLEGMVGVEAIVQPGSAIQIRGFLGSDPPGDSDHSLKLYEYAKCMSRRIKSKTLILFQ